MYGQPSCHGVQVCGHAAEDISNYKELFPSIFTAQALTNCDLFTLDAEDFHQLVEEYPKVKVKLHAWAVRSACCTNTWCRCTFQLVSLFSTHMLLNMLLSMALSIRGR